MISNDLQYRITAHEAEKFATAIENADQDTAHLDPLLRRAVRDALDSQLVELRAQLAEYEAAHSGKASSRGSANGADSRH